MVQSIGRSPFESRKKRMHLQAESFQKVDPILKSAHSSGLEDTVEIALGSGPSSPMYVNKVDNPFASPSTNY